MSKCFNPDCLNQNQDHQNFCQKCGQKLLLKDHFRGIKYLGEGGFGRAFVGIDEHRRNSHCVIKQFLPLQQGSGALNKCIQLFEQEAELLEKLGKHPQIPDLLAFFEQDSKLYLIQEFVEGKNLLTELQSKGIFKEDEVNFFLIEMLPLLDFIHNKNIIHRDIKPENILRRKTPLDPSIYGKISDLVLIDFGVSKQVSNSIMTQMGTTVGTPAYSAPEQTRGIVNPSSDLYSLAVTAIRLLTGVLPKEINGSLVDEIFNIDNFTWIWKEWLTKNGLSVSNDLANILDKMLADKISDRFQSAWEVLDALNTPLSTSQIQPPVINIPTQTTSTVIQPTTNTVIKLQTNLADFSNLEQLLAQKQWEKADQETGKLILEICHKQKGDYLEVEDCQNFPLQELKIIDDLWIKYSNGHFGFSIQKEIWIAQGGTMGEYKYNVLKKFGDKVGWQKEDKWLEYLDLNFSLNAPKGHLPCGNVEVMWNRCGWLFFVFFETQTSPKVIQTTTNNTINLQNNLVDFSNLEQLLAQQKWKKADQETRALMFKIVEQKEGDWLDIENCQNFPLEELKIIDDLWIKYSKGQFGFSVQKQIWLDEGILNLDDYFTDEKYKKFGIRIGWRKKGWFGRKWINHSELTFDLNAPKGHLPCCGLGEIDVEICALVDFQICSRL